MNNLIDVCRANHLRVGNETNNTKRIYTIPSIGLDNALLTNTVNRDVRTMSRTYGCVYNHNLGYNPNAVSPSHRIDVWDNQYSSRARRIDRHFTIRRLVEIRW